MVDIIIIVLLAGIVIRGRDTGLVRQLGSSIGFVAGLFLGAILQPYAMQYADTTLSRSMLALLTTLACALALANIGEYAGSLLKLKIQRLMPLDKADRLGGSVAAGVLLLAIVWLLNPIIGSLPFPNIQQSIQRSIIVSTLNQRLPSSPQFISSLDRLINPNGFPDVFSGIERRPLAPDTPLPSLGELQPAVQQTRASIVKLEGRGCGGIVEGSGFVAAPNVIITNAHVVAGVKRPIIVDTNGSHAGTVIWFDSDLDMAVVRTNQNNVLAGSPLALNPENQENGTPGVVVGYPGGGGFTASPATILDSFTAVGRDIYGKGRTARSIYEIRGDVIPGNSGGPLINKDGQVIGLVFATSTTYEGIGYTLTLKPVADNLQQALQQNSAVGTGACAA